MEEQRNNIREICLEVLEKNWRNGHTIPAEGLYPHQWLWDSCFIAIGLRHIDVEKAQEELRNLLRGQWANGMLPHMIFASKDKNSQDRKIWQSWRNPNSPDNLDTSGMTQPPMLAEAVLKVGEFLKVSQRRSWFQDMFPSLLAHHEWLYAERDPHQEGLAILIHPWESGLDNSPPWTQQLHLHSKPWWVSFVEKTKLEKLVLLFRRDTQHVPPGQRLNNIDALLYYSVLQRLRRKNWDIDTILNRSHFAIEDLAFNSILVRANSCLKEIAKSIAHKLPQELLDNMEATERGLEKLWDGYYKQYFSRNFITHKLIKEPSIATLLPLYAGSISKERAQQLVDMLHDKELFDSNFPVPSVPLNSEYYKELGYWQGPTWINTNWLIAEGLERYGFKDEAKNIKEKSIRLVETYGNYEYFSAKNGDPAGAKNFSWTAALIIDFLGKD
jgi:glycogen debranching enzyme